MPLNPNTDSDHAGTNYDDSSKESEPGDQIFGQKGMFDGEQGDEKGLGDYDVEDGPARKRRCVKRGRRDWSGIGLYYRTEKLDPEIDAAILAIATEKMNGMKLSERTRKDHPFVGAQYGKCIAIRGLYGKFITI